MDEVEGVPLSVVAIGSTPTIDSMRLLGFEVVMVPEKLSESVEEEVISKVVESRVVIIEEPVYSQVSGKLRRLFTFLREPPLLVVVPSMKQPSTRRLEELYQLLSYAVGVRLRWAKKEE
ncbi:MAG: V-type ATP synthase subunit F [Thermofilum sp.]